MMLDGCAYGIAIFDSQSQFIASNRNWKETIGNAIKDLMAMASLNFYQASQNYGGPLVLNVCNPRKKRKLRRGPMG